MDAQQMQFNNLLTKELAGAEDTEVVVSHVVMPPHTIIPLHYHPGEEFAYIIEGSICLKAKDREPKTFIKGEACVVPYKLEHTVETAEESATLLVFRVHEQGEPERYLVE